MVIVKAVLEGVGESEGGRRNGMFEGSLCQGARQQGDNLLSHGLEKASPLVRYDLDKPPIGILTVKDRPCEAKLESKNWYARRTMHARGNGRHLCATHFISEVRQEPKADPRIQFNIYNAFLNKYAAVFV